MGKEATTPAMSAHFLAWSIGLAPTIMLILSWGEAPSAAQRLTKSYALPVLAVELTIIAISLIEGYRLGRPPPRIAILLSTLVLIAWGTALAAPEPIPSLFHTLIWTIHLLFAISIANLTVKKKLDPAILVDAIAAGFLIFLAAFAAFIFTHYEPGHDWVHAIPVYNNIRWFGYYAAATTGLCAWGWLEGRQSHLCIAVLALAAALWTGSRGAFAAVLGAYLLTFALFPFARKGTGRFFGVLLLAMGLAAVATFAAPLGEFGPQRLIWGDDSGRIAVWRITIDGIAQRPWLGWGEAQFNLLVRPQTLAQPHNIVLQVLMAWGAIGAALIASLTLWLASKIRRAADAQSAPFLLGAMTIAAFSLIDGALYHVQSTATFAICIAILYAYTREAD